MQKQEEAYRIVKTGGTGEIEEKKSRFLCAVRPAENEEQALGFLTEMRKKYWDARHNCHAYVIGAHQENVHCSDDGEPAGTAGRPMLEVLLGEQLCNTAVVVTRYFGGTLLGTGGLVRAYTQAIQEGLKNSTLVWMLPGQGYCVETDYSGMGKILYLLEKKQFAKPEILYGAGVTMQLVLPRQQADGICHEITELTNGRARIRETEALWYEGKEETK